MEKSAIESVIEVLQKDEFHEEANNLKHLLDIMYSNSPNKALKAANEIQGLCQVRAYGDLAIRSMSGWDWNVLLEKAQKLARKKYRN